MDCVKLPFLLLVVASRSLKWSNQENNDVEIHKGGFSEPPHGLRQLE